MSNAVSASPELFQVHRFQSGQAGPRLIVLGAVHGNETCGPRAIERVIAGFESGALKLLRGSVSFVPITNRLAYERVQREGERNLNRNLGPVSNPQDFEDRIANQLCPLLGEHDVLIDLHSFQSPGQPFAMLGPVANTGPLEPFALSAQEEALVARLGPQRIVEGWLSTYAEGVAARVKRAEQSADPQTSRAQLLNTDPRYGIGTTEYMRSMGGMAVTLECGQHADPVAPEVAYRAILNALAHLRLIDAPDPAPCTDIELLRLVHVTDRLHADDAFVKTWASFDPVRAGELIGHRHDGTAVCAQGDGYIVFPNIKAKPGNEWFYFARRSSRALNLG